VATALGRGAGRTTVEDGCRVLGLAVGDESEDGEEILDNGLETASGLPSKRKTFCQP